MPRTKPLYIYPSKEEYKSLFDELLDIHTKIQTGSTDGIIEQVSELAKEVGGLKLSTSEVDKAITEEIDKAKGVYPSINDRFLALDKYDILKTLGALTTTREYEYKSGMIHREKVRGDLNFDVTYEYDSYENLIREVKKDLSGSVIGEKHYTYTEDGYVASVSGVNSDDIMFLSNALIDNEQNKRLENIEAIDIIELGKVLEGWQLVEVAKTVQELVTQVQHLMLNLPENIGYLIDTSEVFRRLDDIEMRLDANNVYYSFDVNSLTTIYAIPDDIAGKNFSVFMEGLLLEKDVDYKIEDNQITFFIPLIDDFTVSYKD